MKPAAKKRKAADVEDAELGDSDSDSEVGSEGDSDSASEVGSDGDSDTPLSADDRSVLSLCELQAQATVNMMRMVKEPSRQLSNVWAIKVELERKAQGDSLVEALALHFFSQSKAEAKALRRRMFPLTQDERECIAAGTAASFLDRKRVAAEEAALKAAEEAAVKAAGEARVTAEEARITAEEARVTAEEARVTAEEAEEAEKVLLAAEEEPVSMVVGALTSFAWWTAVGSSASFTEMSPAAQKASLAA